MIASNDIGDDNIIPESIIKRCYITDNDLQVDKVRDALTCNFCGSPPMTCVVAENFSPGICLLLHCRNKNKMTDEKKKRCDNWYFCSVCKCRVNKRRVSEHFSSKIHLKKYRKCAVIAGEVPEIIGGDETLLQSTVFDEPFCEMDNNSMDDDDNGNAIFMDSSVEGVQSSITSYNEPPTQEVSTQSWLENAFANLPEASEAEVMDSFGSQQNMKFYFFAEHVGPHGGIRYLVSRAFKKTEYLFIGLVRGERIASVEEAKWHFQSFVQYISMTNEQRRRQSFITRSLVPANDRFFQATRTLDFIELNRFYGKSNQHCLWNTLPVPIVTNINGIAYVDPPSMIRYLLAFDRSVDEFLVTRSEDDQSELSEMSTDSELVISRITESNAAKEMVNIVRNESDLNDLPDKHKTALLLWLIDWRDGFGTNRTKQQRKSTVAWTLSISTPHQVVNSISNTLPIAVGLKKNPAWPEVEHRFRSDMAVFDNGRKAFMVYHGGLKKVIPVYVKRLVNLTDKVERSDYTATISCTSQVHRCFGKIIALEKPGFNSNAIDAFIEQQKNGRADWSLKQFGWATQFVEGEKNGAKLPSCLKCRIHNVQALRDTEVPSQCLCNDCANWNLSDSTKHLLGFAVPKSYPTTEMENCPIKPPVGREVGLQQLQLINLDFPTIVAAIKYAFFNSKGRRGRSWNKENCRAYLRTCGINRKHQDMVYEAAVLAHDNATVIDYDDPLYLGTYKYAAAYCGDLALNRFIETLMHLLFLGIMESLFTLTNKVYTKAAGKGEETFKKKISPLLKDLAPFNLSWLLVLPFSGSETTKLTTGTWVSENFLAFTRIVKVCYAWFGRDDIADERRGVNDLYRVFIAFNALVARLLSHSGVDKAAIRDVDLLVKEFLSSVNELDIRLRHKQMNKSPGSTSTEDNAQSNSKKHDVFWLKSNFMSLLNLVDTMKILGLLINFWDGGGKGERYIQEIKPHIPRGVREGGLFFVRLMEKIYKLNAVQMVTAAWDAMDGGEEIDSESDNSLASTELPDAGANEDDNSSSTSAADTDSLGSISTKEPVPEHPEWSVPMQDEQMKKARTIYIYKKRSDLQNAINNHKPISGVIMVASDGAPEMRVVFKAPGKTLGWLRVAFDDTNGVQRCGMWYAPMTFHDIDDTLPPATEAKVKKLSKMAVIAIPLHYILDRANHEDNFKFGVITNWWTERSKTGQYLRPSLDWDLYEPYNNNPTVN